MKKIIVTATQLSLALKSARQARSLSQVEAGKLVGLLPKTISALENRPGSASISSLLKLLSALELELVIARKDSDKKTGRGGDAAAEEW